MKGAFAFDGIVGAYASPHTPGTAYVLLHHCFGEVNGKPGVWGHAVGGMGAITQAMARRGAGARRRHPHRTPRSPRSPSRTARPRASGSPPGEHIAARAVAANVPPKLLFRDLVPEGAVEPELRRRFTGLKSGSGTFRMNVALSELPDFRCRPGKQRAGPSRLRHRHRPDLDYLDRAYLDARALRLVARAGGRDADPLHARRDAGAGRASMSPACSCSTWPRTCPMAAAGTTPRRSSPTS